MKAKVAFLTLVSLATVFANEMQKAELGEVVISASGFEQSADSNLRQVVVVKGEDIASKGYNSLQQALQRIAGVSFVNSGAGDVIDLRGQGSKANVSVKVMIDSKPINLLDATVAVTPINSINIQDIERIEIIPGGGSVLYGNGTRGGVINIITKKQRNDLANFTFSTNSFGRSLDSDWLFDMNVKTSQNTAFNFDINFFNKHGYRELSKEEGYYTNSKFLIDINDDSSLNFAFSYYKNDDTSTSAVSKELIEANPKARGEQLNTIAISRPSFDINYNLNLYENLDFDAVYFWQKQNLSYKDNPSTEGSKFTDTLQGVKLKARYGYLEDSYLVFGYDFAKQENTRDLKQRVNMTSPLPLSVYANVGADMGKQSHSVFALNQSKFNDYLGFSAGLRYENSAYESLRSSFSQTTMNGVSRPASVDGFSIPKHSDSNIAFEITPNFSYSDTGKIYVKYERGFISPNPSQFTNKRELSSIPVATYEYYFADLKSEIFDTYELGLSDLWWDFYEYKINAFYTKTKDEIVQFGPGYTQWWENRNIDETRRFGFELSLNQYFSFISFYQSLSYIDAKITGGVNKGKLIPYVSRVKAAAGLDYSITSNLNTFLDFTYFSRSKDGGYISDSNTGKMVANAWNKDYLLSDIGFSYKLNKLNINGSIKNLFDNRYYSYANSYSNSYIVGDGRSYHLGFTYNF